MSDKDLPGEDIRLMINAWLSEKIHEARERSKHQTKRKEEILHEKLHNKIQRYSLSMPANKLLAFFNNFKKDYENKYFYDDKKNCFEATSEYKYLVLEVMNKSAEIYSFEKSPKWIKAEKKLCKRCQKIELAQKKEERFEAFSKNFTGTEDVVPAVGMVMPMLGLLGMEIGSHFNSGSAQLAGALIGATFLPGAIIGPELYSNVRLKLINKKLRMLNEITKPEKLVLKYTINKLRFIDCKINFKEFDQKAKDIWQEFSRLNSQKEKKNVLDSDNANTPILKMKA